MLRTAVVNPERTLEYGAGGTRVASIEATLARLAFYNAASKKNARLKV